MPLNDQQQAACGDQAADFSHLKALFINCTLESSREFAHTEQLMKSAREIMEANGVTTEVIRTVDPALPPGDGPHQREEGLEHADWPALSEKVSGTNILVIGTPSGLGEESLACRLLLQRLYAECGRFDEGSRSIHYGRAGGCVITGNEDGIKHCAMSILYALQLRSRTRSRQSDTGPAGKAGSRPSRRVETGPDGSASDLARLNATFMVWKVLHMASSLENAGGLPPRGSEPRVWIAGCRFDSPGPDHR